MTTRSENYALPKTTSRGVSIDILWFLVILAGFLFFTSLIPLPPNDFWWHLKIGEYIYSSHSVPTTNMFAWTLPADQPYFYAAWLADLLIYILYLWGGLALTIFTRTLLIGITIWLVAKEAHRGSASWRITAFVITLLVLMITNNIPVRTQMWAWIPFILTLIILKRYIEGLISWHWLLLCPIIMLFWVNVHGSFILGIILFAVFFIGEVINRYINCKYSLSWQKIGLIFASGILTSLATLVNPRFFGIVGYTVKLLTDPSSQKLIEEWQSPTPQGIANISFFISILIFVVLLAYTKYRLTPTEMLLYVGFLWLAWSGQRYVIWYGMISTPILAKLIKELPIKFPSFTPQKNWLNLILAMIIFIPVILIQPWWVEKVPLPDSYWQQVLRHSPAGPLIKKNTPVAAAEYLKNHPGGHLYNEMGYGSYLIWAIPEQKVFVDPRVELYPYDQWIDYIHANRGTHYNAIFAKYGVDRILLDKQLQVNLLSSLAEDQLWKLEYEDNDSEIWTKVPIPQTSSH